MNTSYLRPRALVWAAVGLFLLFASIRPVQAAYRIERVRVGTMDAVLPLTVLAPELKAAEWIVVAPYPMDLPSQSGVRSSISTGSQVVTELGPARRPLNLSRVKATETSRSQGIDLQVHYHAELWARHLVTATGADGGGAGALEPVARSLYVRPSYTYDFTNGVFGQWLKENKLARTPQEQPVDYARRFFLAVKNGFRYDYSPGSDRKSSAVCRAGRSDCGGMSALFVSAMRTAGIPARSLVGRWAASAKAGDKVGGHDYQQWHVKAEFFADGVGWVPVDLSSAVLYDKKPDGVEYFGHDRGDFFVMHVDPDLEVDSIHFGKHPVQWLQGVVWWVSGGGSLKGHTIKENWVVTRK
jgi:transglutaminase-like putative cysteine protease